MVEGCSRTPDEPPRAQFSEAAYIHKAEHIEERRLMMQWWADYLDANRERHVGAFGFGK